jgi:hypothetical protein
MSKKWKVAIGVVVAVVIVCGIGLLYLSSMIYRNSGGERGWSPAAYIAELIWGPGASAYIPKHGWGPAAYKGKAGAVTQLEVRLLDDNGDGIPDRGVIEVPKGLHHGWGYSPSPMLRTSPPFGPGHGLHFGRGLGPHFGRGFAPLIVGGLFCLAFLALLIGLAVACFRCWRRAKATREHRAAEN